MSYDSEEHGCDPPCQHDLIIRALNRARSPEFEPWETIPKDRRRGEGDDREVLGETFLGQPVWLPWMGGKS
jgi:hypothetical protein